eukprot:1158007-Pelagomonas_calceolata.AAC.2
MDDLASASSDLSASSGMQLCSHFKGTLFIPALAGGPPRLADPRPAGSVPPIHGCVAQAPAW